MAAPTKVSGRITTWKAWVFTSGTMEGNIKASTRMIRSTVSVCILGLMVALMRAIGGKASSMVLAPT